MKILKLRSLPFQKDGQGQDKYNHTRQETFFSHMTTSSFDPMGEPILTIGGQTQSLKFKYIAQAFPEKLECTFVLQPIMITKETSATIHVNDEGENFPPKNIPNIYGETSAYEGIVWDEATHIKLMREGILYPLDASFSLQLSTKEMFFDTLEGDVTLTSYQEYPYGGTLPYDSVSLDDAFQCYVSWDHEEDGLRKGSKGLSFGHWVRNGGMVLDLMAQNIHRFSTRHALSVLQMDGLDIDAGHKTQPVKQPYISQEYRMLDSVTMRVSFFPTF